MKIMIVRELDCETEKYQVTDEQAKLIEKFIRLDAIDNALENQDILISFTDSVEVSDFFIRK